MSATAKVTALSLLSELYSTSLLLGPPPPDTAPELTELTVSVDGQCATVSGRVFDLNRDLATVSAEFANGSVNAVISVQQFSAGRLDYTNYANCYLEYSSASFILREQAASGGQCRWQDNDGSCFGPTQSCSTAADSKLL